MHSKQGFLSVFGCYGSIDDWKMERHWVLYQDLVNEKINEEKHLPLISYRSNSIRKSRKARFLWHATQSEKLIYLDSKKKIRYWISRFSEFSGFSLKLMTCSFTEVKCVQKICKFAEIWPDFLMGGHGQWSHQIASTTCYRYPWKSGNSRSSQRPADAKLVLRLSYLPVL